MIRPSSPWQVVILRPKEQGQPLCQALTALGAVPHLLPTLHLIPCEFTSLQLAYYQNIIKQVNWMFVASQNAVYYTPSILLKTMQRQKNLRIITMGAATSLALTQKGLKVFFTPPSGSTSETVLAQPFFQTEAIQNQRILLLVGAQGRQLLAEVLQTRQAKIEKLVVYQQASPTLEVDYLTQLWRIHEKICFVATSLQALENLLMLTPSTLQGWLKQCPFIVISERVAQGAMQAQIKHVLISHGGDPESIIRTFEKLTTLPPSCQTVSSDTNDDPRL